MPPFPLLISGTHIEHVLRSVSFILLTYGAIETILSYANTKKKSVFFVAGGLIMLAFGEFIAWYSVLFPESTLYKHFYLDKNYWPILAVCAGGTHHVA